MNTPTITRIEVEQGRCRHRAGVLAVRRLRSADGVVRVALVATEALLLAGDHVRIEVEIADAVVEIVETAGTVAHDMRGASAVWDVSVRLGSAAHLTWLGQPFVVSQGADVARTTAIDLDAGCTAALGETLVLGRTGEYGGTLRSNLRASFDGRPLLVEALSLGPGQREGWAVLGGHRVLDTRTSLGARLPEAADTWQLDGPGSVRRWMGDELHRSPLSAPF